MYLFHFGGIRWKDVALYLMAAGIGAAMASTIHGERDSAGPSEAETAFPMQRAVWPHGAILLLYCVDVWFRLTTPLDAVLPVGLSLAALMLLSVSAKQERDRRSSGMMEHAPQGVKKWRRAA